MEPAGTGPRPTPKTASRLVWAALVAVLAVVAAAGVASLGRRSGGDGGALGGLQVLGELPDFDLSERSGRRVRLGDLRGTVWVADFVFTRCAGVCPVLSTRMAALQEPLRIGEDPGVRLVSFSVDPAHDSPEVLREYAARYGASEQGWLFLTGERDQLHRLIKDGFRLSVAERDAAVADPNEMITHSDRFVLVDGKGRIRGYYHGTEEESVARLVRDLQALRRENG